MRDANEGSGLDTGSERLDQGGGVSRRRFLAGAAGATLASGVIRPATAALAAPSRERATRQTGRAFLVVGREVVGLLKSWQGGEPVGRVETDGTVSGVVKKHIGAVSYRDIVLRFGLSLSKSIYTRIASMLNAIPQVLDGAVVMADAEGNAKSKLVFTDALITEIGFPALNAASDAAAFLEMTLAPTSTEVQSASGKFAIPPQKQWLASNFRLQIPGVDATKVSQIGAFSVRQPAVGGHITGPLEVPDLSVVFSTTSATSWNTWAGSFLPGGSTGDAGEKSGEIQYLASTLVQTLSTVKLSGLGVIALAKVGFVSGSESISKIEATLYGEEFGFVHP